MKTFIINNKVFLYAFLIFFNYQCVQTFEYSKTGNTLYHLHSWEKSIDKRLTDAVRDTVRKEHSFWPIESTITKVIHSVYSDIGSDAQSKIRQDLQKIFNQILNRLYQEISTEKQTNDANIEKYQRLKNSWKTTAEYLNNERKYGQKVKRLGLKHKRLLAIRSVLKQEIQNSRPTYDKNYKNHQANTKNNITATEFIKQTQQLNNLAKGLDASLARMENIRRQHQRSPSNNNSWLGRSSENTEFTVSDFSNRSNNCTNYSAPPPPSLCNSLNPTELSNSQLELFSLNTSLNSNALNGHLSGSDSASDLEVRGE